MTQLGLFGRSSRRSAASACWPTRRPATGLCSSPWKGSSPNLPPALEREVPAPDTDPTRPDISPPRGRHRVILPVDELDRRPGGAAGVQLLLEEIAGVFEVSVNPTVTSPQSTTTCSRAACTNSRWPSTAPEVPERQAPAGPQSERLILLVKQRRRCNTGGQSGLDDASTFLFELDDRFEVLIDRRVHRFGHRLHAYKRDADGLVVMRGGRPRLPRRGKTALRFPRQERFRTLCQVPVPAGQLSSGKWATGSSGSEATVRGLRGGRGVGERAVSRRLARGQVSQRGRSRIAAFVISWCHD